MSSTYTQISMQCCIYCKPALLCPHFNTHAFPLETHRSPRHRIYAEFDGMIPRDNAFSMRAVRLILRSFLSSNSSKSLRNGSICLSPIDRNTHAPWMHITLFPNIPRSSASHRKATESKPATFCCSRHVRMFESRMIPHL